MISKLFEKLFGAVATITELVTNAAFTGLDWIYVFGGQTLLPSILGVGTVASIGLQIAL